MDGNSTIPVRGNQKRRGLYEYVVRKIEIKLIQRVDCHWERASAQTRSDGTHDPLWIAKGKSPQQTQLNILTGLVWREVYQACRRGAGVRAVEVDLGNEGLEARDDAEPWSMGSAHGDIHG
ncbi:hypothetical protein BDV35DRAFT_383110 [Aspergillus flavus]|uniref:Unnamed protein product n=3 Tax=Aspergillus subgen. Circumdati TaxID=2720871 RepID=A0AAN5BYH5_ASPOZ|nr:hypothetical protein BDV35DRAFT_383110 [Aspergillus flavus]GMF68861.1 unnamed protein product [Aspergillus oryzae]GMG42305.1 unnamed protein product [Aspergillus oryzae var. brunneus]GMF93397.1 unnamed protein product [Aspergillus oryzae]GMG09712.1 unnamed protein product [Aspergillus oryzae]